MSRLTLLLVLLLSAPALCLASVTVPASFQEVISGAALIVRGHVTETRVITASSGEISTVATVAVESVLKGTAAEFVSVLVPGGQWGGSRTVMVGAPVLKRADAAVFCLNRGADGLWRPVGLSMGVFRVARDPATTRPVINAPVLERNTAAGGRVVRGDRRRRPISVSEFESLVRGALGTRTARPRTGR
jgi:hypothetical protein